MSEPKTVELSRIRATLHGLCPSELLLKGEAHSLTRLFTEDKNTYSLIIHEIDQTPTATMDKVNMVPGFILKLWKMINDPQCDDLISWSDDGQSFIIINPPRFAQELSKYFKHNNLSSFVRQLNMYGFRKVATIENTGPDDLHFYHPDFVKNQPDRLEAIKRKLPQKVAESLDLRNVIKDISDIEGKQKDITKTLTEIKRENEMLWAELHDLRQKHQQQQLYISRLMKLVFEAMEQNGIKTNTFALKRNSPLMIEGVEEGMSTNNMEGPMEGTLNTPNPYTVPTASAPVVEQPYFDTNQGYQHLEETIKTTGDQIDTLASFMDFSEENMTDLLSEHEHEDPLV